VESAAATAPRLSVVIPTYNAVGQVEPLLRQLLELDAAQLRVIVADDASPDGTAAQLAARFPQVTVVAGEENVGFGPNVNRGVELVESSYLAILNSDVELVGNPFTALIARLEQEPRVFAVMPLIYNTAYGQVENLTQLRCRYGLPWHEQLPPTPHFTRLVAGGLEPWLSPLSSPAGLPTTIRAVLCGAAFVCRTADFRVLEGFDPRYEPCYWEDVDLGYRAARLGRTCETVSRALVMHRHSESIDRAHGERKLGYMLQNQLRFTQQHRDALRAEGLRRERLCWLLRAARAAGSGQHELAAAYWTAALGSEV
jgi:N-acetylglucosaminyl-diphospho-decaprenol L-rhamnosyltransferase